MNFNQKHGARQYGKVAVGSEVNYASPHRLVQMLMEGALEKIAIAKGHMDRKEHEKKGKHINWAISIINGLRSSLNQEEGGEMANNLDNLYDYMVRRLSEANLSNDMAILDEISSLILEIKMAWDAIPDEIKQPAETISKPVSAA
ncbi:MAG: flagellar export chaperone FliS [Pseudomonadota bacterium]